MAYVDSSILVAIMLREGRSAGLIDWLNRFDRLIGSNLVEAEVKSARRRENFGSDPAFLNRVGWILPERSLTAEIDEVLTAGYLRGADLWHVASALYFAPEPNEVAFLTLDLRQRDVAETLGFRVN